MWVKKVLVVYWYKVLLFSHHRPVSSPLVTIPCMCPAMEHRDCGLKGSLSIGIKFSSPSHHHPVSSPLVSLLSPSCLLSSLLPLVTIPCVCPAMEHRDCGLKRSLSIGIKFSSPSCHHPVPSPLVSLSSPSCLLSFSSPSRHYPMHVSCSGT